MGNPEQAEKESKYLNYLPSVYRDNEDYRNFFGRFLKIFEETLDPIEQQINQISFYFDPFLTTKKMVSMLAFWIGMPPREEHDLDGGQYRHSISKSIEFHKSRGTKEGLKKSIRFYTGIDVEIEEHVIGMRLSDDTRLGWNTMFMNFPIMRLSNDSELGSNTVLADMHDLDQPEYHFTVNVDKFIPEKYKRDTVGKRIKEIVDEQKPAFCTYAVKFPNSEERS